MNIYISELQRDGGGLLTVTVEGPKLQHTVQEITPGGEAGVFILFKSWDPIWKKPSFREALLSLIQLAYDDAVSELNE